MRAIRFQKNAVVKTGGLVLILAMAIVSFAVAAGWSRTEISVSAAINPERFSTDAIAMLTVTVDGSRSADIHLPDIPGLTFHGRGRSSQIRIINGAFSSSIASTYTVQAEKPGRYTIPPLAVAVDGSTLTTKPISFDVTAAGSTSAAPQSAPGLPSTRLLPGDTDKIAFLRISELPKTCWTGEVIPIRIQAYFRQGIKANLTALPILKADGFVLPQLDEKPLQTEEHINGVSYSVLSWDSSISAVKEGRHTLSLELEATLFFPQRRNLFPGFDDQDLLQDDFFQNFFGGFDSKNVKVTSQPVTIESRPLPDTGRPRDFSGAIGRFNLLVTAKPSKVEVGEPVTLTMIVSGKGNFDRVEPPVLPEDPKWKTYPPSVDFKPDGTSIQGKKTFEQALMIKDDGVTEIPPVSFAYFDPEAGKYITLQSPAIPLSVTPGSGTAAPASVPSPRPAASNIHPENRAASGLAPIHLHMGRLQQRIVPLFAQRWFAVALILCTAGLIGILLWTARSRYLESNPAVQRKRYMKQLFAENMSRIDEAAAANDSRTYLAASRRAIQDQLGRSWGIEPSTITLADLKAKLPPSSILITLFEAAEQSAYANASLSPAQLLDYTDQLRKELSQLL